jgi:hypothetical protein
MISLPKTIKLFMCDLNWTYFDKPFVHTPPSMAHDWAYVDPQEYFDYHQEFGGNTIFCQAYTFNGVALYPSRLGPNAPDPGNRFLPRLLDISHKAGMPFCSYFCVGADLFTSNVRETWLVPGSRKSAPFGFLAPESPWTDLLCKRITEFLSNYPVEAILFDWFVYGSLTPDYQVQPGPFVAEPFEEIIGHPMPHTAQEITSVESLKYRREVLSRQYSLIRQAVDSASPETKIGFNVPYWKAAEDLWVDHPMVNGSDILLAESTHADVLEWLLSCRKPGQRVMTTIIGRIDEEGQCDPASWRKWYARGLDFSGYAWGTPPDFRPHPRYTKELEIVRAAYREMGE